MVNDHNKTEDIVVFEDRGNGSYLIRWGVTPMMEKDEEGNEVASSLSSYTIERYDYKPSVDIVLADIAKSDNKAALAEVKAICEGLGAEPLEYMKRYLLSLITDYDQSEAVNAFMFNGTSVWFEPSMRATIRQGVESCKTAGRATYDATYGGMQVSIPVDTALQILAQVECYALDCQNVTATHKAAAEALTTVEEVEAYDYKTGYPGKITIDM